MSRKVKQEPTPTPEDATLPQIRGDDVDFPGNLPDDDNGIDWKERLRNTSGPRPATAPRADRELVLTGSDLKRLVPPPFGGYLARLLGHDEEIVLTFVTRPKSSSEPWDDDLPS